MDVGGLVAGSNLLTRPAEEFENDPAVEALWAQKAFEFAEIHFNIICSVEPKYLRLTDHDDELYDQFRKNFPAMNIKYVDEDEMKSPNSKEKWRSFIEDFKHRMDDLSFGTLLRKDSASEYSDENTILTTRIQFYAVEVARNREGCNDILREKYRPSKMAQLTE